MDFNEMSNNEILLEIKKMEIEHNNIKMRMVNDYDSMVAIEKKYKEANNIILKRLKGGND